jgi:hypothetical protein
MSIASEVTKFAGFSDDQLRVIAKLVDIRRMRLNFALNHHVNTRGEAMDFDHYPHIRDLYNTIASDIVLMGSVQSFKSEWSIIDHFACAFSGLSVFFVLPKYEMRTTYVQNRVNRCVEQVGEYKKIIGSGFFDSVALKNFGQGVIKYVGSNVIADFKEFPADVLFVEEVDQCAQENLDFAQDRLRASRYQFRRYLGNPTIEGTGVHKYFKQSKQREWWVPCDKCGGLFELDWFTTIVEDITDKHGNIVDYRLRDTKWEPGCRRDIYPICPECSGTLDRVSVDGAWKAKEPAAAREGLHISMMCSTLNSLAGMWSRFRTALNDPGLLKRFFNSDLGLPFSAAGNKITDVILDRCVDPDYKLVLMPDRAFVSGDSSEGPCVMGVDVGTNLDVRISKIEAKRVRRVVFVGKIRATNVEELHDLIVRYNVEEVVIDAAPELVLAQDFQEAAACRVWLCRYSGEGTDRRRTYNPSDLMISVDRTEALDRAYAALRMSKVVLPANYQEILGGDFVAEMCLPVRQITEDAKGNSRYEWTRGKDHQRHADAYEMLAAGVYEEAVLDDIVVG